MTTGIFDVTALLKPAIKTWWEANSATLSALGTPIVAADDGSPASTETGELPVVVIRFGDADVNAITNKSRLHTATVTFQVYGNTRDAATAAAAPLDKLIAAMCHSQASLLSLAEGNIVGVELPKFACRQISKMRWRAEREVAFEIRIDRVPS